MTQDTRAAHVGDVPGPQARSYIARDQERISPSLARAYPLVMQRGEGSLVWDVDGNRYLDFCAGIAVAATGHSHPHVVRAIQDQAASFLHMSGAVFYYPALVDLAEKLTSLVAGDQPKQVLFTNSGAEAVESALKLVRYHSKRPRILAFLGLSLIHI